MSESDEEYSLILEISFAFESAWRKAGTPPRLLSFVPGDSPYRTSVAAALVEIDLEKRLKCGFPIDADAYLNDVAELRTNEELRNKLTEAAKKAALEPKASPAAYQNVLFGIMAVEQDFVSREALIQAMRAWILEKHKPLEQIMIQQGHLNEQRLALLESIVAEKLKLCGGDAGKCLAEVLPLLAVQIELEQLGDVEIMAILAKLPRSTALDDPHLTPYPPLPSTRPRLRFQIIRERGRGGLGIVYVARDWELGREVALKEIQGEQADIKEQRSRFVLEAEITGGLEHPGIVPVYSLGDYPDGRPYYAMRLIKGASLQEFINRLHGLDQGNRTPGELVLPEKELLRRFVDACNAISYAHSRGILHRDLKPSNIMIGDYRETLVVDWGLAKALGRREGEAISPQERTLRPAMASSTPPSAAGTQIGTPGFMSPEQEAGKLAMVGPASDVYSLGATLYTLLTGKITLSRDDPHYHQRIQKGDFPPPQKHKPGLSPALAAICLKAMALEPRQRYASPLELAKDIDRWLQNEPVSAWPEPWKMRARRWLSKHRTLVTSAGLTGIVTILSLTAGLCILLNANARVRSANQGLSESLHRETAAKQVAEQQKAVAEQRLSKLAETLSDLSDREFLNGNARAASMWLLRAIETARSDDPLQPSYRRLLAGRMHSLTPALIHDHQLSSAQFVANGRRIVTSSENVAWLWDTVTQKIVATLAPLGPIKSVTTNPGSNEVMILEQDGDVQLYSAVDGSSLCRIPHDTRFINAAISPDGSCVMTGSLDGQVRLWDAHNGHHLCSLHANEALPRNLLRGFLFSPDSHLNQRA